MSRCVLCVFLQDRPLYHQHSFYSWAVWTWQMNCAICPARTSIHVCFWVSGSSNQHTINKLTFWPSVTPDNPERLNLGHIQCERDPKSQTWNLNCTECVQYALVSESWSASVWISAHASARSFWNFHRWTITQQAASPHCLLLCNLEEAATAEPCKASLTSTSMSHNDSLHTLTQLAEE